MLASFARIAYKMTILDKIIKLFDEAGILYEKLEHEPVYTSEDAAKIRDTGLSMGAKALILFADKKPVLVVVPGDKRLDFNKFKKLFSIKDLRMAAREEVYNLTGLEVGSIPPVGKALNLQSYYSDDFKQKDMVAFNAGMHTVSIKMKASDLLKVEEPLFGDFSG